MIKAFKHSPAAALKFARSYQFIGDNRKAETDISGSFKNCNPSKDCAIWCYASLANARPAELMKAEFTEWVAENHPDVLADTVAQNYNVTAQGHEGLALRINDKGDLSAAQVVLIKELNRRGIRMRSHGRWLRCIRLESQGNQDVLHCHREGGLLHVRR